MAMSRPLHELSIAEAGAALRAGDVTSTVLTQDALGRIGALDGALNSFVLVTGDRAMADAAQADSDFASGIDKGPMQGIPYALKDIYDTAGIRTTCHSKLLRDNVPTTDCVVQQKLAAGGGVLMGKVGTFEFAIGGPSVDLPFPPARNPWNTDHVTGGSSSGSGAAVAGGLVRMAMGSDTGGSIRWPAALCGVVGLKPTYGRVSRRGIFPLSYTLDHAGPLSWSVEDAALTLQVIAGYDALDPASANVAVPDYKAGMGQDLSGLRIGYTRNFFVDNAAVTPAIVDAMDAAAQQLAALGATVDEVELPAFEYFAAAQRTIMFSEAYAIHEQDLKTRPMAYGKFAYRSLISGAVISAADLVQALRLRTELTRAMNQGLLSTYHSLLMPCALDEAYAYADVSDTFEGFGGVMTGPQNITGNPCLALPIGFGPNGMPLGCQLVGRPFDEAMLFRIGAAYEAAVKIVERRPELNLPAKAA